MKSSNKKITGNIEVSNHVSRNGFDISRRVLSTQKLGEILPMFVSECIPGDKFKLDVSHFGRTLPVQTAAFTRLRQYYDWFFVPYRLLWRDFPSMVTNMPNSVKQATSIVNVYLVLY